jgi:replicative DNA helicase
MQDAAEALKSKNIYIDDKSRDMQQIKATIRRVQKDLDRKNKGKLGMIVIDYVQMIHGDKKLSRNYQLEEISRGLKELAKDNEICVLALSQLSREVDSREKNKPIPSDLRDSGSFEQVKKRVPVNHLIESGSVTLIASMNAKSGIGRLNEVIRM